jgi:hypothetical protein
MFKLYFCHLFKHPYFSKTVETPFKDVYVLVAATPDPLTQKYVLPRDIPDSNLQKSLRMEKDDIEVGTDREVETSATSATSAKGPKTPKPASNDFYDSSSRDWTSIPRPKDVLWSSDTPNSNSPNDFPALPSRSDQNRRVNKGNNPGKPARKEKEAHKQKGVETRENETSLIDLDDEPPVIKHSILQKNPNKNASNKSTIGRMYVTKNFSLIFTFYTNINIIIGFEIIILPR